MLTFSSRSRSSLPFLQFSSESVYNESKSDELESKNSEFYCSFTHTYIPVTNRLSAEKMRGNCGIMEPRATLTILYNDSLANKRTRTSGSCRQFNTGDTNSSTYLSVSLKNENQK